MGWPGGLCAAPGVGPAEGQAAHLVRTWLGVFFRWRDWAAWLARPSSRVAAPADMMPPGRCGVLDKVLPFEGPGGSEGVPLGLARVLWKAASFPTPFTGESPAAAWTLALPACLQPDRLPRLRSPSGPADQAPPIHAATTRCPSSRSSDGWPGPPPRLPGEAPSSSGLVPVFPQRRLCEDQHYVLTFDRELRLASLLFCGSSPWTPRWAPPRGPGGPG